VGYWINHSKKCADDHDSHHATIIFLRIASNFFSKKSSYAMGTEASFVVAMVMVMIFI